MSSKDQNLFAEELKENQVKLQFHSISTYDPEEIIDKVILVLNRNRDDSSTKKDLIRALDDALSVDVQVQRVYYLIAQCTKREAVHLLTQETIVELPEKLESKGGAE